MRRSWEAARAVRGVDRVVVATDDDRIRAHCEGFGAEVVMTSPDHRNGTERVAEAAGRLGGGFEIVVNLQGDAPLTPRLVRRGPRGGAARARPDMDVATPVLRTEGAALAGFREDRRAGRVGGTTAVFGAGGRALYFSKEVVPYTGRDDYGPDEATPGLPPRRRLRLPPRRARRLRPARARAPGGAGGAGAAALPRARASGALRRGRGAGAASSGS